MKKLNEKGLTLVELIVSFALVSVAMLYFYQTVSTVSKLYKRAKIQTNQFTESTYTLRLVKDYCSIEENLNNCIEKDSTNSLNNSFLKKIGSNLTVSKVVKDTQTIGSEMYSVLTFEYKDSNSPTFGLKDGKYLGEKLTYKLYIKSGIAVLTTGPDLQSMLSGYTGDITEVVFDKETSEPTDGDWVLKKDISVNGNGTVWGILRDDPDNSGKYIFHISFNRKKVYANPNSSKLFSFYKTVTIGNNISSLKKITGIETLDTSNVTDMSYMFYRNYVLESLDVSHFKTDMVEKMNDMFDSCSKIKSLDVSGFKTNKVTTMEWMFDLCREMTNIIGLTSFNTENVNEMRGMFARCSSLNTIDVSSFNIENVKSGVGLNHMFHDCSKITVLDLRNFKTINVKSMSYTFSNCKSLRKIIGIENWDTSNVTGMLSMFNGASLADYDVLDLSKWDTSKVTSMRFMFTSCSVKALKLRFDTSNVTNMGHMFYKCDRLEELDLGSDDSEFNYFSTPKVTSMLHMFSNSPKLKKLDISNFDTSSVTDIRNMFEGDISLSELKINKDKFNIIKGKTITEKDSNGKETTYSYYHQMTRGCKKEIDDIIKNQVK